MTITANFHNPKRAEYGRLNTGGNDTIRFEADGAGRLTLFVAPHVAEHTAAAFNRAMQAVPILLGDGWKYTTKSGVWYISRDSAMRTVYLGQHEDVTGDNDPAYLFAQAASLIGCMDAIDDTEAENACSECHRLSDDLKELDSAHLCFDCLTAEAERQAGMREMALDDMAHAAREKAAGL